MLLTTIAQFVLVLYSVLNILIGLLFLSSGQLVKQDKQIVVYLMGFFALVALVCGVTGIQLAGMPEGLWEWLRT